MRVETAMRIGGLFVVLLLLSPVAVATIQAGDVPESDKELRQTATNVTFITTQGGSVNVYQHAGKLAAVHTGTGERLWIHEEYRRYMDVDPLGTDRVLVVAGERTGGGSFRRVAVVLNWRTGQELRKFEVPLDTHDVDAISDSRFAVASKADQTAYIINATSGTMTWQYDFRDDFGPSDGDHAISGDWTHLNDIDLHNDTEGVLLSPRDFDRVIYLNRSTNEIQWTLGKQDRHEVLHAQHNPVILQFDPLTVLVADSENDRVIEYQRTNGTWNVVWSYSRGLHWPRDADRLPNGNTLITDTLNDRVIEVTPSREVVWQHKLPRSTYDAERLQYGDEPAGPPMTQYRHQFNSAVPKEQSAAPGSATIGRLDQSYNRLYQLLGAWILPPSAGRGQFIFVIFAGGLAISWAGVEVAIRTPVERLSRQTSLPWMRMYAVAGVLGVVLASGLLWVIISEKSLTSVHVAVSMLLTNLGYGWLRPLFGQLTLKRRRVDMLIRSGLFVASIVVAGGIIYTQFRPQGRVLLHSGLVLAVMGTASQLAFTERV